MSPTPVFFNRTELGLLTLDKSITTTPSKITGGFDLRTTHLYIKNLPTSADAVRILDTSSFQDNQGLYLEVGEVIILPWTSGSSTSTEFALWARTITSTATLAVVGFAHG